MAEKRAETVETDSDLRARSTAPVSGEGRRSLVQSISRATALLDALRDASGPMTVLELSAATGLDRTVTHRMAKSLAAEGLLLDERGTYRIGPATVLLANRYIDDLLVRRLALPYMVEISSELGDKPWTVTLSIPVGTLVTVIERIWTPHAPLGLVLSIGDNFPIDSSATGRSILAASSDDEIVALLGRERAESIAPIIGETRAAEGVGISRGEAVPGVQGIAASINSRRGTAVAAIGVSGVDLGDELAQDSALSSTLRRAALTIGQMVS